MCETYLQVTLPNIVGKDRCKGKKGDNEQKRSKETYVIKNKVIEVMVNS